jgi:WhiB family redox-sensing transcriptional regulator
MGNHARLPASTVNWRDEAACRPADPALFFGPENEAADVREAREAAAKAVCSGCPVRHDCLQAGLMTAYGVWGGLTEDERQQLKRRQRRARAAVA